MHIEMSKEIPQDKIHTTIEYMVERNQPYSYRTTPYPKISIVEFKQTHRIELTLTLGNDTWYLYVSEGHGVYSWSLEKFDVETQRPVSYWYSSSSSFHLLDATLAGIQRLKVEGERQGNAAHSEKRYLDREHEFFENSPWYVFELRG